MNLRLQPNPKQFLACKAWADNTIDEICFGGAKYGGKSFLGASLIFADALTYPGTQYFIAREKGNDLRKFTIPTVHEVFGKYDLRLTDYMKFNGQDNYFTLYNDSKVFLLECKELPGDPMFERFGSMQMTRGWIEEAGEVSELAYQNLLISIGRWKNAQYNLHRKLLITCNPKIGWLKRVFYDLNRAGKLESDKAFIQALPTDNTKGDKDYIEQLKKLPPGTARERLLLGNWEYEDDPTMLCTYESIEDIFSNEHIAPDNGYITADIARFGADSVKIYLWSGFRVEKIYCFKKSPIPDTAQEIREIANEQQIPMSRVVVDEDGVGGGVKDILNCHGFVNNSKPIEIKGAKENYTNLKSQCYFRMAKRVNDKGIYIAVKDTEKRKLIREDLGQVKDATPDGDQKKAVISKDKVKEALGRSPDDGDNLMMREYFELVKSNTIKINW